MRRIEIHVIPGDEVISCHFDVSKSFGDLKDELNKKYILSKATYFFKMNNLIMDDNMILKDNGVADYSFLYAVRNDCINVILKLKDSIGCIRTVQKYMLLSDFKVIKADENKEVKVCNNNLILCFIFFGLLLLNL